MGTPVGRAIRSRGFTLIELLVAVAIFGVLSGMAYRVLMVVLDGRDRIELETRKWRELALFFTRLEQDVTAIAPRPDRDGQGALLPAVVGNSTNAASNDAASAAKSDVALILTRTGFATEPGGVAPPQRLGYRLRAGVVELLSWNSLDQGSRTAPRVSALLREITALDLRYLDRQGQWSVSWPPRADATAAMTAIPAGIELTLTLASGQRITRLLPTAARLPE